VDFNNELNDRIKGRETELTFPNSKVRVAVIPTNEELAIAIDTEELVEGK
jgi:acetate kinase